MSRLSQNLLSICLALLTLCAIQAAQAQTPTNTTLAITGDLAAVGMIQGPDGNYYSTTGTNAQSCNVNSSNFCSYIYKITSAGVVTKFHSFQPVPNDSYPVNSDGALPTSLLVGTDGNLYGICTQGGAFGYGTVFQITMGGVFTTLYSFSTVSVSPASLMQASDGYLYGVFLGGIFKISTSGSYSVFHTFPLGSAPNVYNYPEGYDPTSIMQGSDGNFYVTMAQPAGPTPAAREGAIDQITPGSQATVIYTFPADNSQGGPPLGPLVEGSNGNLYGVTKYYNLATPTGAAFSVSPSGSFQILHQFSGGAAGAVALGPLFVGGDGNFYGTTGLGGDTTSANCASPAMGCGIVYQLQPSGTFTTMHQFEGGVATPTNLAAGDGATPQPPLVQGDMNLFYGTTFGNAASNGTIFELFVPNVPQPIDISLTPSTAAVGSPVKVTWQVHNAFSQSAQVCGASVVGNPTAVNNWSGQQTGTFANNVYSGSATITPAKAGNYNIALTCGGNETGIAMLTVPTGLAIGPSMPNATVNQSYSPAVIPVTGGVTPYIWSISGVPAGLMADTSNGTISGTPTQFGNYTIAVTVTDSSMPANQVSGTVSLMVLSGLQIITTSLVKGTVDANYLQKLSSSGGLPPYTWSVISGSLPANLQIINFGTSANIVNAPTTAGKTMITLQVADNENNPATQNITLPLNIVPSIQIGAIEFTQEIQEYQTLEDLQASLASNNEPPVPIIASKPAVMRVYFTSVKNATNITLTATGTVVGVKPFNVPPSCSPPAERAHNPNSCPSLDIYFIPPPGPWSTVLTLEDNQGNQLEQETLNVTSRTALGINLKGVALCTVPNSPQSCQSPSVLLALKDLATKILPTNSLTLNITTGKVSESLAADNNNSNTWELSVVQKVENLYTPADAQTDAANQQRTTYVGVYSHTSLNNDTGWGGLGYNGAIIPDVATRLGTNATDQVFAHEVGHTLDLPHTGTQVPAGTTPPGCYGPGATSPGEANAWIYTSNYIQSYPNGTEYGFDFITQQIIDGGSYFDVMSYCVPRWISPFNFKASLVFVNGGPTPAPYIKGAPIQDSAQPKLTAKTSTTFTTGQYWIISGSIQAAGVTLNPIFTETTVGTTDPGSGTYSIQAQAANGQVLYTRFFTPFIGQTDTTGTDQTTNPLFSQFIPVTSGTAMIVIKDPTGIPLTTVPISGTSPTVTIISPATGFTGTGQQSISWTAQSPTATSFTSRVYYSIDNGKTWQFIEEIPAMADTLDFNTLPGASAALIRIDVSDGVNTGSATSIPFSVPKKLPSTIVITSPKTGAIQPAANPVYLSGGVYDADDGILTGTALAWSDNVQGSLGTGSPLLANLNPGNHTVTLTGTDSDGNAITATTQITLGGSAPNVTLTTSQSTGCYSAVINATPGSQGANLTAANYSLDGGVTYTAISLTNLPFNLNVPGAGNVNLVATAIDASGQVSSQSTGLNLGSGCVATTLKISAGSSQSSPVGSAFTTPLTALVVDVNGNPVAGATVTFTAPTTGASATLSATTAVTNISGIASVTATANGVQGSYNVTASATNATATANFTLINTDFQIAAATPTLTVARGSSGTDVITLTALGGFNGTVNFTCSGLPSSGVTCAFSSGSVTPTTTSVTTTMTITVSQTAASRWPGNGTGILACCLLGLLARRRRFLSTLTVLCVTAGILMLAGCGGSSSSQQSNPITSSVTVTASSGNLQRTATITLQVP